MDVVRRLRMTTEQATSWEAMRATLEALPVPAAVLEANRTTIAWNGAAERAFGWTAAEVLGTRLPLVADEGAAELRALLQTALNTPTPIRLEVEGRTRSGESRLLRIAASALPQVGKSAGVLVTFEDVTALAEMRRRLRRARKYSRGVAELSPEALLIVSDGVVTFANAASARLLGISRRNLIGESLAKYVQADPAEIFRLASAPVARDSGAILETTLRHPTGDPLDVEIVARTLRFRGQRSLLIVIRDASLRRRVELELARTKDRFRVLSESVQGHAVIGLDTAGVIISWNGGAERLFGHVAAAVVGHPAGVLFRDADVAAGRPEMEMRTTLEVGRFEGEEWRRRADGTDFWAAVTIAPQYAAEDRLIGFTATVHDLTERLEAQEALRRTEEQLRHAQRMEAVGRLAAGVAHDFNNLLTAIRGYAQLLLEDLGDDPRTADVEEIRRAADRGTTLTRQLLAVGRRQVIQQGVLDLNSVVIEAEKMLRRIVGEDVALVTELEASLGRVNADASQMEQVVLNLVVNARDALPNGGRILIATRNQAPTPDHPDPRVILTVSDTGTGMDAETQRRIFEPFFTTKPPGKGTGLGLSTVYGIVEQSGGHITFQSAPGSGTTFDVSLPRVDEPVAAESSAPEEHPTILVALQDRMFRNLALRTLERRGYVVLEAASASEAVRVARLAGRVDLLLADSALQGPGGRALVESLAGVCGAPRVLYVADSPAAASQPSSERDADVITKPFTPLALARRIRLLLDRGMAT